MTRFAGPSEMTVGPQHSPWEDAFAQELGWAGAGLGSGWGLDFRSDRWLRGVADRASALPVALGGKSSFPHLSLRNWGFSVG